MKHRLLPRARPLLLSLLLVLLLLAPASYFSKPYIIRWDNLRQLTSSNLAKREQALNYLIRRGKFDPAVVRGAIAKLDVQDSLNFLQIVNALDQARQWRRPPIPEGPWLRWLEIIGQDKEPQSKIAAARGLAELHELGGDPRVSKILHRLMNDDDDDVRLNVLVAAAELAGVAPAPGFRPIVARGAFDKNPEIARQAWIFLGLFHWTDGMESGWKSAPPRVAQAMLWALLYDHPDRPAPALEALADEKQSPLLRGMAAYALHQATIAGNPAAQDALRAMIQGAKASDLTPESALILWRAMLAAQPGPNDAAVFANWLDETLTGPAWNRPEVLPILYAAAYRTGTRRTLPAATTHPATNPARRLEQDLIDLAALECPGVSQAHVDLDRETPDMLRLTSVAAAPDPRPDDLRPLLSSDEPTMRDLACVVASDRFTREQNAALLDALLHDLSDQAKMSGAILAGLTGVQTKLLAQKMADEDVWVVKEIMRLGLWMQGQQPEMASVVSGLFARQDIPKTTLLLALLHQKNPLGLDYLLNPRGEPPLDLIDLLDEKRWWRVLKRYLPPTAPPLWVWADPDLERFQLDVLRNWYLVHRQGMFEK